MNSEDKRIIIELREETFAVSGDQYQWTLYRAYFDKKKNKRRWIAWQFFPHLSWLIQYLIEWQARTSDVESFQELHDEIKRFADKLSTEIANVRLYAAD